MDSINAIVKKVRYYNEENGFIIISAKLENSNEEITIQGNSIELDEDLPIFCEGNWIEKPKYGKQFKAESIKPDELDDSVKILKYLESGAIKGIGPKTAELIVSEFGSQTLHVLDEDIDKLQKISGIGPSKLEKIKSSWIDKRASQYIITDLLNFGLTYNMALKIFSEYKEVSLEKIKEETYLIIDDIKGFTFEMADKIALSLGKEKTDPDRIISGIVYVIKRDEGKTGNTCIEFQELITQSKEILKIEEELIKEVLKYSSNIIKETTTKEGVFLQFLENDRYEKVIAQGINKILKNQTDNSVDEAIILKYLKKNDFPYSDQQVNLINNILKDKVGIITGGPGVGKTTVLKAVIDQILLQYTRKDILNLASPTGKAAQRMAEATDNEAKTIHRLLEYDPEFGGFSRNEKNKIEAKYIIIDESSMVDLWLFYSLISAIDEKSTLIIIGDSDQLASVGSGAVLRDLIESKKINVHHLNVTKRQAEGSSIISNAHRVNNGEFFEENRKDGDFYFIRTKNDQSTLEKIIEMVNKNIPNRFGYKTEEDIQILTPMHKGVLGTQNINNVFQKIFNKNALKSQNKINYGDTEYYENDKIIQTVNNYEKMIFNGDTGKIIQINGNYIIVDFEGKEVELKKNDLADVTHFYGGTIHKSQGSEYPVVIIPITTGFTPLLDRTLLYTGITRGKKLVIIIGSAANVDRAIQNKRAKRRKTLLKEKLIQYIN